MTGSDKTDPLDSFDIDVLSFSNNTVHAAFVSRSGRTYTIEYCTNLTENIWYPHPATPLVGDGSAMTLNKSITPDDHTFYRIKVERN